jgi:hypothetical protein
MTKELRAGESSLGWRRSLRDLSPSYLSSVARTPFARRLLTLTCQRLCGESVRGPVVRVPSATSSNRRPPEFANFRSKTCVGVADLSRLHRSTCPLRSRGPQRARAQLRGRPISEKRLITPECNEACENTELSPLNAKDQLPGRLC